MASETELPLCPKCGCPPQWILARAKVRVGVHVSRDGLLHRSGKQFISQLVSDEVFECGGGHRWPMKGAQLPDSDEG